MDFQPTNQEQPATEPAAPQTGPEPTPPMAQPAAPKADMSKLYLGLGILVVVVIVGLGAWYYVQSMPVNAPAAQQTSAVEQSTLPPLTGGNTTTDIQNDLNQIPNDSAAMTQDQNSLNTSIQGL